MHFPTLALLALSLSFFLTGITLVMTGYVDVKVPWETVVGTWLMCIISSAILVGLASKKR